MKYDFSIIRELRRRRKLTIVGLHKLSGVCCVALSKLERNEANPALQTLDRIARTLGLATHNLLALAAQQEPLSATESTCRILGSAHGRLIELDGCRLFVVRAPKGAAGDEASAHRDDYERCFVLEGQLKLTVRGRDYILRAGQGLMWDTLFEHHYEVQEPSLFLTVLTPKGT